MRPALRHGRGRHVRRYAGAGGRSRQGQRGRPVPAHGRCHCVHHLFLFGRVRERATPPHRRGQMSHTLRTGDGEKPAGLRCMPRVLLGPRRMRDTAVVANSRCHWAGASGPLVCHSETVAARRKPVPCPWLHSVPERLPGERDLGICGEESNGSMLAVDTVARTAPTPLLVSTCPLTWGVHTSPTARDACRVRYP